MPRKNTAPNTTPNAAKKSAPKKRATKSAKSVTKPASATNTTASKNEVANTPPVEVVENKTVTEVSSSASVLNELSDEFAEFLGKLNQVSSHFSTLKTDFRTLEKKWTRELRSAHKTMEKRKRKVGNRAPSGFVKPTLISDELATFLGKTIGTEMARTEVTREINKYIRANALQDKDNGRKINPDSALTTLLKVGTDEELTYFNLQRYMSPHFAKLGAPIPAANISGFSPA